MVARRHQATVGSALDPEGTKQEGLVAARAHPVTDIASPHAVTRADVIGGWRGNLERPGVLGKWPGWRVIWPDGLWQYEADYVDPNHGGARWRLAGDTLCLANDYLSYYHPMFNQRELLTRMKHQDNVGIIDLDLVRDRPPFSVPDSVYWSENFRATTDDCGGGWRVQHLGL